MAVLLPEPPFELDKKSLTTINIPLVTFDTLVGNESVHLVQYASSLSFNCTLVRSTCIWAISGLFVIADSICH